MKVTKKEIIIRLIRQVYDYSDEIIHLRGKIKELENDLKEYKENDKEQTITTAKNKQNNGLLMEKR